jgi:hypothetical protein
MSQTQPTANTFTFDGTGSDDRGRTTPSDMTTFLYGVAHQPYGAGYQSSGSTAHWPRRSRTHRPPESTLVSGYYCSSAVGLTWAPVTWHRRS